MPVANRWRDRQSACRATRTGADDKSGELLAIASTHVDDLKLTGTEKRIAYILQGLEKQVGKLKTAVGEFEHCGIKHCQSPNGETVIHQNRYSEQLSCLSVPVGVNLESLFLKLIIQLITLCWEQSHGQ